jgi:NAD(P)-dependent dehydrogenase (short-subunit alcohol dehydrogenase family)
MYVVTGATGNTGSVVANSLLSKGHQVRVLGRSAERLKALAAKGGEPFLGDMSDSESLAQAFTGAKAVYVMIPPDMKGHDYRAFQDRITEATAGAIEKAQVEYVVSLSSVGADKPAKTGPVVGVHLLEQRLNRIAGLNVLCRMTELMTYVPEYVTQNVRINDIDPRCAFSAPIAPRSPMLPVLPAVSF